MGSPEGEKNALIYNESAFLLCVKTMINVMHDPPESFEPLVRAHFRQRGPRILACCRKYLAGARVGSVPAGAFEDGGPCELQKEQQTGRSDSTQSVQESRTQDIATPNTVEAGASKCDEGTKEASFQPEGAAGSSQGFKLMLRKVLPKLEEALAKLGVASGQHVD